MRFLVLVAATGVVTPVFAQSRPHPFDLLHVKWEVTIDPDKKEIKGDVMNRLIPAKGTKEIELDSLELRIKSVEVANRKTSFKLVGRKLKIALLEAGDGKVSVDIRVKYTAKPRVGMYFIPANRAYPAKTPVVYTQGEMEDNRGWLPTYDYPDDKATSEGIIHTPTGWKVLSNGRLVQREDDGKTVRTHWSQDLPHSTYLISLVAGPYSENIEQTTPVPVSNWVPTGLEAEGMATFGMTHDVVSFYGRLTGVKYPWAKYTQSAVPDFMFGGMENVTCTTQTISALYPPSAKDLHDDDGLVAHELAHQWFGDLVTTSGWSDAWINEGWATFLPPFWTREKKGEEAFQIARAGVYAGALAAATEMPERSMVFTKYKDPIDMFDNLAYPGGATRMFMLMNHLGEEKFWSVCQKYLEERKFTNFDTKAFFATWSKYSGEDLTPFMNQWFFTPGAPDLTFTKEGTNLVVKQKDPRFKLDIPVWILDGKDWIKKEVKLNGAEARLDLGADSTKPVLVDPEAWILARFHIEYPMTSAERIALYNAAPNAARQVQMFNRELKTLSPAEQLEFAQTIESSLLLQNYVGRLGQPEASAFLITLLDHKDIGVVDSAVNALQGLPKTDAILAALDRLEAKATSEGTPNPDLLRDIADARLTLTNDPALAEKAWNTADYADRYRVMALNWWNKNKPETARERALEAINKGLPEPTRVHAISLLGSLKDEPNKHVVYDTLIKLLNDDTYGARSTAITSLGQYGNPKALSSIRPFLTHPLSFYRGVAVNAVQQLSAASGKK